MKTRTITWRHRMKTAAKCAFLVVAVVGGVLYVATRWDRISVTLQGMDGLFLVVALVAVVGTLLASMVSWRVLWPAFGVSVPVLRGARLYFVSQLGKYVPGSVWSIAAQAQMAGELGLSRSASVVLSLVALLVSVAVGLGVGVGLLPFVDDGLLADSWWLVLVAGTILVCVAPRLLRFGVRAALRLFRRRTVPFEYSRSIAVKVTGAQVVACILGGFQLWSVLVGLGVDPTASFVPSVAGFALASSLGILLVPFPAGVGVREFVITAVLATVSDPTTAVTAAILSRLLFIVSDFCLAALGLVVGRPGRSADVAPSPESVN